MPTWGEILAELHVSAASRGGVPDFDSIRRRYIQELRNLTNRDTIIYYTDWLAGGGPESAITLEDMQALMEVCKGLGRDELDLVLHSPGGSAEATASIVRYLRQRFKHIRVFVPLAAMSAGTMLTLSADVVVMGAHSQLGPIDPQIYSPQAGRYVPARAIVEQFNRAKEECKQDPAVLAAWLPILQQYGPALISECEDAEALSKRLVEQWLSDYMFAGDPNGPAKAKRAAEYFGNYVEHKSHSLPIDRDKARLALGVPSDHVLEAMVAIGRQADRSTLPEALQARETPSARLALAQIAVEGRFSFD